MPRSRFLPPSAALIYVGVLTVGFARTMSTSQLPSASSDNAPQLYRESISGTLVTFEMVLVPGGPVQTQSGSTATVEAFYIGRTEVTWDAYDVFALRLDERGAPPGADAVARPSSPYGAPDYGWGHAGYPAISVTRAAAHAFCEWLSLKTGKTYRLPTDAEWTRAASLALPKDSSTASRLDALAWHLGNAGRKTHAVATKQADALGLYDLFGNAAEWVGDESTLVVRGGSFRDAERLIGPDARAVQDESWNERDPQLPKSRWWLSDGPFVGFRIVRKP